MARFEPGYIFGKKARPSEKLEERLAKYRERDETSPRPSKNLLLRVLKDPFAFAGGVLRGEGWPSWNTPIANYGDPIVNTESLLEQAKGRQIKILDVGVGRGSRWLRILRRNPNIEFHGTSLSETFDPILPNVKVTQAGELHKHHESNSFDYVFSHMGIHAQSFSGMENIVHLLKPGGEAIITISRKKSTFAPPGEKRRKITLQDLEAPEFYQILAADYHPNRDTLVIHLRKNQ